MQTLIRNYFKNGCLTKIDKLIALFFPKLIYNLNANKVIRDFNKSNNSTKNSIETVSVNIENYPYNNKHVIALGIFLQRNLLDDLAGAYVHGSAGTDELIPYSDLDAFVIIKDKVFSNASDLARVAIKLKESEKFMYELDPLQHHGWFVISESDLMQYENNYFPLQLFEFCKSIMPNGLSKLNLYVETDNYPVPLQYLDVETDNYPSPLANLCKSITKKTAAGKCPSTLYELKNLLSEFMLLPALYVQVRDGKAVFKKFSFEKARVDFTKEEWMIMDEVSMLRKMWMQGKVLATSEILAARFSILTFISNLFRAKVPADLKQRINADFLKRMNQLAETMRIKMEQKN